MRRLQALCFTLLLALSASLPACSHFTASGRMDRAYNKHMKKIRVAKERRRERMAREIAKMPKATDTPQIPLTTATEEGPQAMPRQESNE